ncbi:alpha/beta hydrolase [Alkalihalobacillus sp. CinArs1]|uniref:alpha/beta hydrolase n=1 Tax=Alkalihalobacillus sp. CinArs1 TaxID=2995314 RepID=UPI0022DD988E|nr:alpha/beta hydrolase [Alkalihalobacillus sp. CinArs1]
MTYTQLLNKTIETYENDGSLEAFRYIQEHADEVEGNRTQIYNFQYALAAASDLKDEALSLMREAVIDHGYWYSYDYLMTDEDLDSIKDTGEFQELAEICKKREEEAKATAKPELTLIGEDGAEKPLLIALHGDQENATLTKEYWRSVVTEGTALALPQSSQIQFTDAYEWEDLGKGSDEVVNHTERLVDQFNEITIGGFSAGCRVALHAMVTRNLPVKGFIFVAPWLPEVEEWDELLDNIGRDVKGYIICGDQDEDCIESANRFGELLVKRNIQHKLKIISGLDHEYPERFEEMLKEAMTYIG